MERASPATTAIVAALVALSLMWAVLGRSPIDERDLPREPMERSAPSSPMLSDEDPARARASEDFAFDTIEANALPPSVATPSANAPAAPETTPRALTRSTLAEAIERHLPDLVLSDNELDELADATLRMRDARTRLRAIPKTREQASRRDALRRALEDAIVDFTHVVEMTPDEFTRRVQPDVGIDVLPGEGATPEEVSIRVLPRADRPNE